MTSKSPNLSWIFLPLLLVFLTGAENAPASLPLPLVKAQELRNQGKYLEAQKAYEQILNTKNPELGRPQLRKILEEYEDLNMKLLFSRMEMPGSVFYEVKTGDSLSKIAKKHKTTIALIKKSNGLKKDTVLLGAKLKVVNGTFAIRVNKTKNILVLYLDKKPFKHYRVATGLENGTPTGKFKIVSKEENPTWYKAGAVVPPGSPANLLGTRWLGFDYPGYGIHGTTEPDSIGKQVTSGCVRMHNPEVEELYDLIPFGTIVTITD